MEFLRRLLGGARSSDAARDRSIEAAIADDAVHHAEVDAAEHAHELDLLRDEQARLDDLAQRQLKYARYSWQPPSQGGDRRADDADEAP